MNQMLKRLTGGLLAVCLLSTTAFAARITPSTEQIQLQPKETTVTFDLKLQVGSAFAGAEFGLRPSSSQVGLQELSFLDDVKNESKVQTEKNGVLYFGFFAGSNKYPAGTYDVARLTYTYSGTAPQSIVLDSSKIVTIDQSTGLPAGDASSAPFTVTITRAPAGGGEGGGSEGGGVLPPAPVVPSEPSGGGSIAPSRQEFVDVNKGGWFYDAVHYAVDHGIFSGVGGNRFAPNEPMTRAMMVTVLWNMDRQQEKQIPVGVPASFTDVLAGRWYADPVVWAGSTGIADGIGGGLFGPDLKVTREQVAVFLYHYEQACGRSPMGNPAALSRFADADQVSDFAVEALSWAVQCGLINGADNNMLCPRGSASRAQTASILMNYQEAFLR